MDASSIVTSLAWTLFHSLWLGLVVAVVAGVVISATKKSTARLRYNLLLTVMLIFITGVSLIFINELSNSKAAKTPVATGVSTDFIRTSIEIERQDSISFSLLTEFKIWFDNNSSMLMMAWLVVFLFQLMRMVFGLRTVSNLKTQGLHSVSKEWIEKFIALTNRIGISGTVMLFESELVKVPVAVGYLKPIILLPLGLLANLPASQMEAILLHELAHIRRKDYLVNLVQHFIDAVFFFNPGIRWISSLVRLEREACCDDMVVNNTQQKKNYLEALIAFQEFSSRQPQFVLGITSRRNYLLNRVKRIATDQNEKLNRVEKSALFCAGAVLLAFTFVNESGLTKSSIKKEYINAMDSIQSRVFVVNDEEFLRPVIRSRENNVSIATANYYDTIPRSTSRNQNSENTSENRNEQRSESSNNAKPLRVELKNDLQVRSAESLVIQKLEEIRLIKEQMQVQKDVIGVKKKQLEDGDEAEKKIILKEIQLKRQELQSFRNVLEQKRIELAKERKVESQGRVKPVSNGHKKPVTTGNKSAISLLDANKTVSIINNRPPLSISNNPEVKKAGFDLAKKTEVNRKLLSDKKLLPTEGRMRLNKSGDRKTSDDPPLPVNIDPPPPSDPN